MGNCFIEFDVFPWLSHFNAWLVVSNSFHFPYMGCHPSHWRTPSLFRGVGQPATRCIQMPIIWVN
jgi:hypothetical protein